MYVSLLPFLLLAHVIIKKQTVPLSYKKLLRTERSLDKQEKKLSKR